MLGFSELFHTKLFIKKMKDLLKKNMQFLG